MTNTHWPYALITTGLASGNFVQVALYCNCKCAFQHAYTRSNILLYASICTRSKQNSVSFLMGHAYITWKKIYVNMWHRKQSAAERFSSSKRSASVLFYLHRWKEQDKEKISAQICTFCHGTPEVSPKGIVSTDCKISITHGTSVIGYDCFGYLVLIEAK